jgi:hypothetical protein
VLDDNDAYNPYSPGGLLYVTLLIVAFYRIEAAIYPLRKVNQANSDWQLQIIR